MAQEYPLLIFPEPQTLDRSKRSMPQRSIHFPSPERQAERLSPLFQTLKDSFEARRAEIQQSPEGVDPDQVIVFETIGTVDSFITAVKNTALKVARHSAQCTPSSADHNLSIKVKKSA